MDDDRYELRPTPPSTADYLHLREASGLSPKRADQAAGALAHSWRFGHVHDAVEDRAVAMGRALGDGGWYFHLADMATLPDHQGRGLGRRVLTWLLAEIAEHAPPDPYVTLLADPPGRPLYRSAGFEETAPRTIGMWLPRATGPRVPPATRGAGD